MRFHGIHGWLAGGAMIIATATAALAQDANSAFDARYAELATAMLAKDSAKLTTILAPEFESTDLRGDTHNRAEALARMAQMPDGADFKPQTKVLSTKVSGDAAAVESQMTVQIKRPDQDGKEMALDIAITADDLWVQRGGAWLLQKTVQKEMTVSRDGEVVFRQAK